MKIIRFRRLNKPPIIENNVKIYIWEIAFSKEHLFEKLNGEMAEVIMPPEAWYIRLWRVFFPLDVECHKFVNMEVK